MEPYLHDMGFDEPVLSLLILGLDFCLFDHDHLRFPLSLTSLCKGSSNDRARVSRQVGP